MVDAELVNLRRARGNVLRRLTTFSKYIDSLAPEDRADIELTSVEYLQITKRFAVFEPDLEEFNARHAEIVASIDDDDLDEEEIKRVEFETQYFRIWAKANNLMKKFAEAISDSASESVVRVSQSIISPAPNAIAPPTLLPSGASGSSYAGNSLQQTSPQATAAPSNNTSVAVDLQNVRLPKINLPTFVGLPDEWLGFRDTYASLIHTNSSINKIQKFHYLRSCLSHEAAIVIQSVEFSAENYDEAWNILCSRYDNTRVLLHNHLRSLFNIENMPRESAHKLRSLLDIMLKNLGALSKLQLPNTSLFDLVVIYIITAKFDAITARDWEKSFDADTLPTLDRLGSFIRNKADLLSTLEIKRASDKPTVNINKPIPIYKQKSNYIQTHVSNTDMSTVRCALCRDNHFLRNCEQFTAMKPEDRFNKVKSMKRCINCLRYGHSVGDCDSSTCRKCGKKHHTMLHFENVPENSLPIHTSTIDNNGKTHQNAASQETIVTNAAIVENTSTISQTYSRVLLSTAQVTVFDRYNRSYTARVLLDSGSQANYISDSLARKLGVTLNNETIGYNCIAELTSTTKYHCKVDLASTSSNFKLCTHFIVLNRITSNIPAVRIDNQHLKIPANITLADPSFNTSAPVDLLLGAEHFYSLLCIGQIKLSNTGLLLQKTRLGWVVAGMAAGKPQLPNLSCHLAQMDLNESLSKFWELEDIPDSTSLKDNECENHFNSTVQRNPDGRFIVSIPFNSHFNQLGDTYDLALKRFRKLEKLFSKQPNLKQQYFLFINEYISLGHMSLSSISDTETTRTYYLPHHAVLNESSSTTKLRVVFDGSAKSVVGKSLNECQSIGPILQDDLFSILIRFRKHKYVISADIAKMYRQVLVTPSQRPFQRILWRPDAASPILSYDLNTVTYGTASASYLAIRCLFEIATDVETTHPEIAWRIRHDFYVDDLLTGANTIEEARQLAHLIECNLNRFCFPLRKWTSNSLDIIKGLSPNPDLLLDLSGDSPSKTLGLYWSPNADLLSYQVQISDISHFTKRNVLSMIAKIFDPLGLLAPLVIIAKILMQKLWLDKLDWDESIPVELHYEWLTYRNSLNNLNCISVPRYIMCANFTFVEMHGFSDASQVAYGACIYIRSLNDRGQPSISLLAAKGKVAPLKTVSIPRLELCGALLLSRLVKKILEALHISVSAIHLWCDSTIVLAWLQHCPSTLRTFVANRVAKIQNITKDMRWSHVPTADNPADLISRGVQLQHLANSKLWWNGPGWLAQSKAQWPSASTEQTEIPELRPQALVSATVANVTVTSCIDINRFSSFNKLRRVMALVLRFTSNSRIKSKDLRHTGPISLEEADHATKLLIKVVQASSFKKEIKSLKSKKSLSSDSHLLSLSPFLDDNGIIRVGGRLDNSDEAFDVKHPILLPKSNHLTYLIFIGEHCRHFHVGPQGLLYAIRQKYWPISGRNTARRVVRECVRCFRAKPRPYNPQMGPLPAARVTQSCPFLHCGVDFAGPFILKTIHSRGCKTYKAYIAVFVCLSTKAIHLELVTDLSTPAFIAALRRFVSRRGKPLVMYSDNGTNFVGANRKLKELGAFLDKHSDDIESSALNDSISWKFIPARSPHFGGIWEAGVKAIKHHLNRIINEQVFTFEDFYTLLVQIEAILNSRPISPMSTDPNDFLPISPAHFLVGRPLTNIPERTYTDTACLSSRYKHIQMLRDQFWTQWSKHYLNELQQRQKWTKAPSINPGVGDMVLLIDDNLPTLHWRLGRIEELHPGKDGIVRVATIRTKNGPVKRATRRIAPLPKPQQTKL